MQSTIINLDALSKLSDESLSEMIQSGIIGTGDAEAIKEISMANKLKEYKEYVQEVHRYKVTEPKSGSHGARYKTRILVYDPEQGEYVMKQLAKTNEYDFYEALYHHYNKQTEIKDKRGSSIQDIYPMWIEYKKIHTTTPTYITRIESDWKRFYVDTAIVKRNIKGITKCDFDEWAHALIKDNHMTKTEYYNATVIMRQLLDYAVDKGTIKENLYRLVKIDGKRMFAHKPKPKAETQVFSCDEVSYIYDIAFDDYRNNDKLIYRLAPLAVAFQFQTGLRVGELCGVKFIDIEGDYIHVQRMVRDNPIEVVDRTKTADGERLVFLTSKAKEIIAEARRLTSSEFIFSMKRGCPLKPSAVHDRYRTYCARLGIVARSSHKARKTYASTLLDAGVNIDTVRRMMGHADERTTLKNYTFDRNEKILRENMIEKALS